MNEHLGRHVKCFLRNSTVVEGIMEGCSTVIQLRSLDGKSLLIIHSPEQDIILTKVLLPKETAEQAGEPEVKVDKYPPNELLSQGVLEDPFTNLMATGKEEPLDPMTLKAKTMAELKIQMAEEERKIIANKLKDHHPNTSQAPRKVTYGQPGFLKKPSAK